MLALDLGSCSSSHAKEGYYKLGRPRWYVRCQTAGLNLGCNPAPLCKVLPIGQRVGSGSLKSLLLIFQGRTSASTSHGLRPPKKNDSPLPAGISYNCAGLLLFFFWLSSVHHPKTRGRDKIACANEHTAVIAGCALTSLGQKRAHRRHCRLR